MIIVHDPCLCLYGWKIVIMWYGFKTENISIFRYFFINIKFVDEIPFIEIKIPFIEFLEFEL